MIFESRSSNVLFYGMIILILIFVGAFVWETHSFRKNHPQCEPRIICGGQKYTSEYLWQGEIFVACLQEDGSIRSVKLPEECR